jgi:hypothetical protein
MGESEIVQAGTLLAQAQKGMLYFFIIHLHDSEYKNEPHSKLGTQTETQKRQVITPHNTPYTESNPAFNHNSLLNSNTSTTPMKEM